jgi:predicted transcriptional regulator of viral defense system
MTGLAFNRTEDVPSGRHRSRTLLARLARAARAGILTSARAREALGPAAATASVLARLVRGGWLARVRRGVYLVLPLEAQPGAAIAVEEPWVLAAVLFDPCYVGGWSAAEHWGLTEQLFRSTFVVTAATVRTSQATVLGAEYRLAKVAKARLDGATKVWRGSERVAVSDRELTIADALASPAWLGGVRHLADVLRSYRESDEWNPTALLRRLAQVKRGVAYKRLGLLVEALALDAPDLIRACLDRRSAGIVALDPSVRRNGRISKRWGLRVNVALGAGG